MRFSPIGAPFLPSARAVEHASHDAAQTFAPKVTHPAPSVVPKNVEKPAAALSRPRIPPLPGASEAPSRVWAAPHKPPVAVTRNEILPQWPTQIILSNGKRTSSGPLPENPPHAWPFEHKTPPSSEEPASSEQYVPGTWVNAWGGRPVWVFNSGPSAANWMERTISRWEGLTPAKKAGVAAAGLAGIAGFTTGGAFAGDAIENAVNQRPPPQSQASWGELETTAPWPTLTKAPQQQGAGSDKPGGLKRLLEQEIAINPPQKTK